MTTPSGMILEVRVDAQDLSTLARAVEEYRQHSSARGELLAMMNASVLQTKLHAAIEALMAANRMTGEGTITNQQH